MRNKQRGCRGQRGYGRKLRWGRDFVRWAGATTGLFFNHRFSQNCTDIFYRHESRDELTRQIFTNGYSKLGVACAAGKVRARRILRPEQFFLRKLCINKSKFILGELTRVSFHIYIGSTSFRDSKHVFDQFKFYSVQNFSFILSFSNLPNIIFFQFVIIYNSR